MKQSSCLDSWEGASSEKRIRPKGLMNPVTRWCIELLASLPINCEANSGDQVSSQEHLMKSGPGLKPGPTFMTYARRDLNPQLPVPKTGALSS